MKNVNTMVLSRVIIPDGPVSDLKSVGGRDAMGIDTSVTRKCSCTPIGREV